MLVSTMALMVSACAPAPLGTPWSLDVRPETTAAITAPAPSLSATPASLTGSAAGEPHPRPGRQGTGVGPAYEIGGQQFVPRLDPAYEATGFASWYSSEQHGTETASGERFDSRALTAAHPTLPLPSYVLVTNMANGRTIMLRVNDRGPFTKSRIIDVSKAAADALGFAKNGVARVKVKYAGPAPHDGNDAKERAWLAQQAWWQAAQASAPVSPGPLQSVPAPH